MGCVIFRRRREVELRRLRFASISTNTTQMGDYRCRSIEAVVVDQGFSAAASPIKGRLVVAGRAEKRGRACDETERREQGSFRLLRRCERIEEGDREAAGDSAVFVRLFPVRTCRLIVYMLNLLHCRLVKEFCTCESTVVVLGESRLESVRGTFGLFGELRVETRA